MAKMLDKVKTLLGSRPRLGELLAQPRTEAHAKAAAEVLGAELGSFEWHADAARAASWRKHDELVEQGNVARDAVPKAAAARAAAEKEHGVALDLGDPKREKAAEEMFARADREEKMLRARAERLEGEGHKARLAAQQADTEAKLAERDRLLAAARELTATRAARFAEDVVLSRAAQALGARLDVLGREPGLGGFFCGAGQEGQATLAGGGMNCGPHIMQVAFTDGPLEAWRECAIKAGLLEE